MVGSPKYDKSWKEKLKYLLIIDYPLLKYDVSTQKTRPDNNASVKSVLSEVTETTSITTRSSLTDSLIVISYLWGEILF